MVQISISRALERRLRRAALRNGRSKDALVRTALEHYLEDLEDVYAAEKVLERVYAGKEKVYQLTDLTRTFRLKT